MEEILKTIKAERDTYLRTPEYTDHKFMMHMMQYIVALGCSICDTIMEKHPAKPDENPMQKREEINAGVMEATRYEVVKRINDDLDRAGIAKESFGRNVIVTISERGLEGSYDEVLNQLCEIYPDKKKNVISSTIVSAAKRGDFSKCITTLSTAHDKVSLVSAVQDYTRATLECIQRQLESK